MASLAGFVGLLAVVFFGLLLLSNETSARKRGGNCGGKKEGKRAEGCPCKVDSECFYKKCSGGRRVRCNVGVSYFLIMFLLGVSYLLIMFLLCMKF